MKDNSFIDTNVFLYAKFDDGSGKFKYANRLIRTLSSNQNGFISVQVINEFIVNAVKKGGDPFDVRKTARNITARFNVLPITVNTITKSYFLFERYKYSHWDCLILASALEAGCSVIFSEDLANGQIIDGILTIINPFLTP